MPKLYQIQALSKKHIKNFTSSPCSLLTALLAGVCSTVILLVIHNLAIAAQQKDFISYEVKNPRMLFYSPNDDFHSDIVSYLPPLIEAIGFATEESLVNHLFEIQDSTLKYFIIN